MGIVRNNEVYKVRMELNDLIYVPKHKLNEIFRLADRVDEIATYNQCLHRLFRTPRSIYKEIFDELA